MNKGFECHILCHRYVTKLKMRHQLCDKKQEFVTKSHAFLKSFFLTLDFYACKIAQTGLLKVKPVESFC